MKILADLGLQRETIKQVSWKAFIFFQKSSDLFQFGKIGKRILVFDELQILAGFESCSWQYCFRLALKQNYKTGYITQAGHGFKLLIRSVRSGIWGGGGLAAPALWWGCVPQLFTLRQEAVQLCCQFGCRMSMYGWVLSLGNVLVWDASCTCRLAARYFPARWSLSAACFSLAMKVSSFCSSTFGQFSLSRSK